MTIPYPAANFSKAPALFAPYPAVFGAGQFTENTASDPAYNTYTLLQITGSNEGDVSPEDQELMRPPSTGEPMKVDEVFTHGAWNSAGAPQWISDLYQEAVALPGSYVHVVASTPEILFAPKAVERNAETADLDTFIRSKMTKLRENMTEHDSSCDGNYIGGGSDDPWSDYMEEALDLWAQRPRETPPLWQAVGQNPTHIWLCQSDAPLGVYGPLFSFESAFPEGGLPITRDRAVGGSPSFKLYDLLKAPETNYVWTGTSDTKLWERIHGCQPGGQPASYVGSPGYINQGCASNYDDPAQVTDDDGNAHPLFAYTRNVLRPTSCSPEQRSPVLTNIYTPKTPCEGMDRMMGALGLACLAHGNAFGGLNTSITTFPPVTSEKDIGRIERWADRINRQLNQIAGRLTVEEVPKAALATAEDPEAANFRGSQGDLAAKMNDELSNIAPVFRDAAEAMALIRNDLQGLRIDTKGIHLDYAIEQHRLAIERLDIVNQMVESMRQVLNSVNLVTPVNYAFVPLAAAQFAGNVAASGIKLAGSRSSTGIS